MTNLTIVAADVAPAKIIEQFTGPAAEAIVAGQYVRFNTSSGKIELGKATTTAEARAGGIALGSVAANETVTALSKGWLAVGAALDALTFDDDVYLSDTDGTLADAAGTVSRLVGTVVPAWGNTTADKLLRVDL